MKKKFAQVNGMDYPEKFKHEIYINSGDRLEIVAASGAQVELTNLGHKTITASCIPANY